MLLLFKVDEKDADNEVDSDREICRKHEGPRLKIPKASKVLISHARLIFMFFQRVRFQINCEILHLENEESYAGHHCGAVTWM